MAVPAGKKISMKEALEQVVDPLRAPVSVSCCCPGAAKMPVLRQRHDAHRLKSLGHSNREMARRLGVNEMAARKLLRRLGWKAALPVQAEWSFSERATANPNLSAVDQGASEARPTSKWRGRAISRDHLNLENPCPDLEIIHPPTPGIGSRRNRGARIETQEASSTMAFRHRGESRPGCSAAFPRCTV